MTVQFTRLKLSNWRNFRKVELPLAKRVFIVGPNASGKSNLLDAFRFLHDIAAQGGSLVNAVNERRGLKHIRSLHAGYDSNALIEVDVRIGDDSRIWTYSLELSGSDKLKKKRKPLQVAHERVMHGSKTVLERTAGSEGKDELLYKQTHLEQISQSLGFRPLADALASVEHVHVVPQVARSPARAEEFSKRDAPGSDFIDQIARLTPAQQKRVLRRLEKLLRAAVPRFSELKVVRDEVGRPHLEARYEHWRNQGGWQNEQEFSDGTLRLIGLLWAIDHGTAPLLLEEPELSLHRDLIRQLPRLIAQSAIRSGRQILVSTHSEDMLGDRGIDPSEIVLLEPSEHETKVYIGSEKPQLIQAARARLPIGAVAISMTKPRKIEQLVLPLQDSGI